MDCDVQPATGRRIRAAANLRKRPLGRASRPEPEDACNFSGYYRYCSCQAVRARPRGNRKHMELTTLPQAPPEPQPKTEVGSYFVANYPPFSVWSPEHLPAIERALDGKPDPSAKLGLYLHIPFCRKR